MLSMIRPTKEVFEGKGNFPEIAEICRISASAVVGELTPPPLFTRFDERNPPSLRRDESENASLKIQNRPSIVD